MKFPNFSSTKDSWVPNKSPPSDLETLEINLSSSLEKCSWSLPKSFGSGESTYNVLALQLIFQHVAAE